MDQFAKACAWYLFPNQGGKAKLAKDYLLTDSRWALGYWAEPHRAVNMRCHNCPKEGTANTIKRKDHLCGNTMQDHVDRTSDAWIS